MIFGVTGNNGFASQVRHFFCRSLLKGACLLGSVVVAVTASLLLASVAPRASAATGGAVLNSTESQNGGAPAATAHGAAIPKTLAAAQAKWPGATYLPSGKATHTGRYLVHVPDGYTLMGVTVGPAITRAAAPRPGRALTNPPRTASSGCWYISQEVYTYEAVGIGAYVTFETWNHTPNSCGQSAYGDRLQPGCSGLAACNTLQGPAFSGQGRYTVNGWADILAYTGLPEPVLVYCRTYFQANGHYWSWCSL